MELLGAYWPEHWLLAILLLGAIAFIAGFVDSIAIPQDLVGTIVLALIRFAILIFLAPRDRAVGAHALPNLQLYTLVPLKCLVIGFYDGFFGPGTGSMFIIAFHHILKMDLVASSANAKTFNFASNIGALVAFIIAGKVMYLLALPLVACNTLGNHLGSALAIRKGDDVVGRVLALSMLCLFASLGVKYLA
jgi:uncharacterized membrane protein YfcA